jgi:hypothetical protein
VTKKETDEVLSENVPKKRGRPKKVPVEGEVKAEPKKRGRPKKVVDPEATHSGEALASEDVVVAPKKRGRPKKVVTEDELPKEPPKKRGRPRKIVDPSDDADLLEQLRVRQADDSE